MIQVICEKCKTVIEERETINNDSYIPSERLLIGGHGVHTRQHKDIHLCKECQDKLAILNMRFLEWKKSIINMQTGETATEKY